MDYYYISSFTFIFLWYSSILGFVLQNVFKSKGFHEISDSALAVILQSNGLLMDEKDILDCVREWATVGAVSGG